MKRIFKYGDHIILGASLIYIEYTKIYTFMITLFLVHLTIDYNKESVRVGVSIGDHQLYLRLQIGLN